jgi:cytochrome c oxidase assembly protein subunit 15
MTGVSLPAERPEAPVAVRVWLYVLAALVVAMVMVGGATRLTDSGLSITEWKPVTGAVPPLSQEAWATEFAKYRITPQYELQNRGMSLAEFKEIYWWEWGHRLLGRLVGIVFALPLVWFLVRGELPRRMLPGLAVIFGLGALQGAIGWWMVASGLVDRTSVAPYRLAVHLTLAFVILAALLWTARSARGVATVEVPARLRAGAWIVLGLAFLQVALGALVAGLDAGRTFTTWPLIDGGLVPPADSLFVLRPAWANFFENPLTAQFTHRVGAYILFAAALAHALDARQVGGKAARMAMLLLGVVTLQAVIGIVTLLEAAPIGLALLHQLGAVGVIAHGVAHVQRLAGAKPAAAALPAAEIRAA